MVTEQGTEHEGWLAACDPVSHSLVLVDGVDTESPSVEVVFGFGVLQITALSDICDVDMRNTINRILQIDAQKKEVVDTESAVVRKQAVIDWLRKNHLPVREQCNPGHADSRLSVLRVADHVTIASPYTPEQCRCQSSGLVLQRVVRLLDAMPG